VTSRVRLIAVPLFELLAQQFEARRTDWFIRWLYADGIDLRVDDYDAMTTAHYRVPVEVLTPAFLKEARALWRSLPRRR